MKKRRYLVWLYCAVLAFVIVHIAFDEAKRGSEMIALCAYADLGERKPKLSKPAPEARAAVRWITAAAGVSPTFEIYEGDVVPSTAFALIKDRKRLIVYGAQQFKWSGGAARWRDVCILGHEVGHHLGAHIVTSPERHEAELEADRFAGYACALMGASLAQALTFTDDMAEADGDTHPGQAKRRAAVTEGWTRGDALKRTGKVTLPAFASAAP